MGRRRAPPVDSEDSMDDGMKMARKGFAQQERIMRRIRFKSISEERRRYNTNGCSRMNTRYSNLFSLPPKSPDHFLYGYFSDEITKFQFNSDFFLSITREFLPPSLFPHRGSFPALALDFPYSDYAYVEIKSLLTHKPRYFLSFFSIIAHAARKKVKN
ncbi:hypothetical protein KQX54_002237 [Cotesia glomerata]|uniref:Uncharacterized protein n=1 Tax=Cotesia glomerata TaxID=32391 RepID=A0AAV7J1I2_COTGL|nr:hypothetical protein KQX54_002237 [Cotesia glomerata]